jgi:CheY-like chemotaxis protein
MSKTSRSMQGSRAGAHSRDQLVASSSDASRLILVADGNTGRGQRVVDECTTAGYPCKLAPHGAAALEIALATRPAVVVAQLELPLVDALKLAEILRANPRTRAARFIFLGTGESLGSRGAVGDRLLACDARPDEIVRNIEELFERQGRIDSLDRASEADGEVTGELGELSLADLLQSFLLQRRTGELTLRRSDEKGAEQVARLGIKDGDVVQAEVETVDGEKALFRLLTWRQGRFHFQPGDRDEPPRILAPTRRLLVEGLRQLEEWDRLSPQLPPLASPLKLTVKTSDLPNIVHPLTQEVLLLLELYGTVGEIVDHCEFPDYQVLRTLNTLSDRGIVQLGRVPTPAPSAPRRDSDGLINEAQARRLRDWLKETGCREDWTPDPKLLVVSADVGGMHDFMRLLGDTAGTELSPAAAGGAGVENEVVSLARVSVDDELGIQLVHLPSSPQFAPFWPVAGHGALGTLFLLSSPVAESVERLQSISASLARLPRARTFHVVLLGKDERIAPDELRENLSLIDEASLFLLPTESGKDPTALLRGLFARVMP